MESQNVARIDVSSFVSLSQSLDRSASQFPLFASEDHEFVEVGF